MHALGLMQVERDRFAVAGLAEPDQSCIMAFGGRPEPPHRIAGDGVLDFQHLGSKLAQRRGGVRAGQEGSYINHPDAAEWQFRGFRVSLMLGGKFGIAR